MPWMELFHEFVIPFLGGFVLTLGKAMANQKLLSFDDSNDIALDLVLVGVGALGAFYIKAGALSGTSEAVVATFDAGIGDAFLAAILLYVRYRRTHLRMVAPVGPVSGIAQLILGAGAIIWTIKAF